MGQQPRYTQADVSYVGSIAPDEKAYHMMYGDGSSLARTNIQRTWLRTTFEDIRGQEDSLDFERSGIAIRRLNSSMSYEDFADEQKIKDVYFRELEDHLRVFLKAENVKLFRFAIRKRHPDFPCSTGQEYDFAQPTSIAHVDATLESTREEMLKQFGDNAQEMMRKRFQWINVWRPLRGCVNDWPLCFCDASSVNVTDLEVTDMVYPEYYTENLSLRPNSMQKWYFLSDHCAEEIIIFKQSDSDPAAVGGVPHCSFANPHLDPGAMPRESIEARALVVY